MKLASSLNKGPKGQNAYLWMISINSIIMLFLATIVCDVSAATQDGSVKGTVTDSETGLPLPGVNILLRGSMSGTITDVDGNYEINVPDNMGTLVFSFIGYETQAIAVEGRTQVDIVLEVSTEMLDEVVVVGYGEMKKSDLTGSVASIKSDEIVASPMVKVDHALQGTVSGVLVTNNLAQPGGETVIRVRGTNSIMGNNDPLYVIDGFVGGDINTLAATDIRSIEVLKDASATAIYGARGANGVILVTTHPGERGKSTVNFNAYYGISDIPGGIELMDGPQFSQYVNDLYKGRGIPLVAYPEPDTMPTYDWLDEMFNPGAMMNYSLSASGGTEKMNYHVSGNFISREGVTRNSYYNRFNLRANVDADVSDWLRVGARMGYSNADRSRNLEENMDRSGNGNPVSVAISMPPILPIFDEDGTLLPEIRPLEGPKTGNPLFIQENRTDYVLENTSMGNFYAEVRILETLKFKSTFGIEEKSSKNNIYKPSYVNDAVNNVDPYAEINLWNRLTWLNENFLTYTLDIDNSSFLALAGFSANQSKYESLRALGKNFALDGFEFNNMGAAEQATYATFSGEEIYSRLSYFARLHYNLKEKYLLTINARYDGSSRFGDNNKWGFFPSAAFAWRMSEEEFIKNLNIFDRLKFRASYGISGSEAIQPYSSWTLMKADSRGYILNGTSNTAFRPARLGDPNLTWEETSQLDVGFDAGFFRSRLNVVIDYYYKITNDLFVNIPYPRTSGFAFQTTNIGKLMNQGIELDVNWRILDKNFKWVIDANITLQQSRVLDLGLPTNEETGFEEYITGKTGNFEFIQVARVGEPLGTFYGYITDGLWQEEDEEFTQFGTAVKAGDIKFVDINEDGLIDDLDRTIIGNQQPKYYGGFGNTFAYKGFGLSVFFQYAIDYDVLNATFFKTTQLSTLSNKRADVVGNTWIAPEYDENGTLVDPGNTEAYYPRISYVTPEVATDRIVEDASFLRLRDLTLGYTLPEKWTSKIHVSTLRVYITGSNLWKLTNYRGFDPEVNIYPGKDMVNAGVLAMDNGSYPRATSFIFGLNLAF